VFDPQQCFLLLLEPSLPFNRIFFPNGVSCETSSDLEEGLCIIEEVEKNPSEKRTDVAKRLGLPPSTLNTIIAKKKIREHTYVSVDQELAVCGRNVW
jgi:hypothetical protein